VNLCSRRPGTTAPSRSIPVRVEIITTPRPQLPAPRPVHDFPTPARYQGSMREPHPQPRFTSAPWFYNHPPPAPRNLFAQRVAFEGTPSTSDNRSTAYDFVGRWTRSLRGADISPCREPDPFRLVRSRRDPPACPPGSFPSTTATVRSVRTVQTGHGIFFLPRRRGPVQLPDKAASRNIRLPQQRRIQLTGGTIQRFAVDFIGDPYSTGPRIPRRCSHRQDHNRDLFVFRPAHPRLARSELPRPAPAWHDKAVV